MEKLCGIESLPVVCHRFSNGVDVLKCVTGFIKEVSEVEQSYSNSIQKLVKSPQYELHSNFIMQLLGSSPYEEIGTLKHTWSKLGQELTVLATMHSDKAKAYLNEVRKPLLDLAPKLEDTRREIKSKTRTLREQLESAANKHHKAKSRYQQAAEAVEKSWQRSEQKANQKNEEKLASLKSELARQEHVYEDAYQKHVEMQERFDRDAKELYMDVQDKETERVNVIKKVLQEFAKNLSNTAPAYLEAMQRIVISINEIDSGCDIKSFVDRHGELMQQSGVPAIEKHPVSTRITEEGGTEDDAAIPASPMSTWSRDKQEEVGVSPPESTVKSDSHSQDSNMPAKPVTLNRPPTTQPAKPVTQDTTQPAKPVTQNRPSTTQRPAKAEKPKDLPPTTPKDLPPSRQPPIRQPPSRHTAPKDLPASRQPPIAPKDLPPSRHTAPKDLPPSRHTAPKDLPPSRQPPSRHTAPKDLPPSRHPGVTTVPVNGSAKAGEDNQELRILLSLQRKASDNDYYGLMRVTPDASADELAGARRDRTKALHPDHFAHNQEEGEKAQQELVKVNQAYQDVLTNNESRLLYDQLCSFREKYHLIQKQKTRGLQSAKERLSNLRKGLKKLRCPQSLLDELDTALHLVQTRIDRVDTS